MLLTTIHFTEGYAQLSDPREKFSITAEITGSPNTSYTWKQPSGETVADGKMKNDFNAVIHASIKLVTTKKTHPLPQPLLLRQHPRPRYRVGQLPPRLHTP